MLSANRHLFSFSKTRALFFAMAICGFVVSGNAQSAADAGAQNSSSLTAKSKPSKKPEAPAASSPLAKPKPTASGSDALTNLPMPIGRDFEGINLPWYDADGHLQMNFHVEQARRTDEDHLVLKRLYVNTYSADGSPDATIEIKSAVLNLVTKILVSAEPVTIERADFKIVGEQMEFNTATHAGKMIGKVKMLIYNYEPAAKPAKSKGGA